MRERLERIKASWNISSHLNGRIDGYDVEWLIEQAERVEDLEKQLKELKESLRFNKYRESVRLREALEFYADEDNHKLSAEAEQADLTNFINNIDLDNGDIARQALERESK